MTEISRNIRMLSKHGNNIRATVLSCAGNTATVRLSTNGAIYKTLRIVGGPVTVGQVVNIDMSSDIPYIVAPGVPAAPAEGKYKTVPPRRVSAVSSVITGDILRYFGNYLLEGYPFTIQGLNDALADVETGQTIVYPIGTLEVDFTIPANTNFKGSDPLMSIIWGTVTLSSNVNLTTLVILDEVSSGSDSVQALVGPSSGEASVVNVTASAFTCGTGNAYGLYQPYGGDTIANNSVFIGESRSGLGYGVYQEDAP